MQYVGNIEAESGGSHQAHATSAAEGSIEIRQVVLILDSIDVQHGQELLALEQSGAEEDLKNFIKDDLVARYRNRRAPYAKFLEELRRKQDESLAGEGADCRDQILA